MGPCSYCQKQAVTSVNIGRGRKLHLVEVCHTHARQLEVARDRDEREKQERKERGPWW
jgi:hypothetical protein